MPAAILPILIEVGADFDIEWLYNQAHSAGPVNLTGYSAKLVIANKTGTLLTALSTGSPAYLALGGPAGTVTAAIPAAVTAILPGVAYDSLPPGVLIGGASYAASPYTTATAHYTLELTSGAGVVTFLATGPVTLVLP